MNQQDVDVNPADWDGVYYDGASGMMVTVEFRDGGEVALTDIATESDEPAHVFDSRAAFADFTSEFSPVPESAVRDPVSVAEDIYNEGYEKLMEHSSLPELKAAMYADMVVEVQFEDESR